MPAHACRGGLHVYPSVGVEITRRNRPECPRRPIAAGMARSVTRRRPWVYPGHFLVCIGVSRSNCRERSETAALARLLRDTIEADHYPLLPRVQMWRGILSKIRPEPPKVSLAPKGLEPKPELLPPQKHYEPPRAGRYGRRQDPEQAGLAPTCPVSRMWEA